MTLLARLKDVRAELAAAAQEVYDSWDPEDEFDEFGGGGICDGVAAALADVISRRLRGVEVREAGQDGDDHAWLIVYTEDQAVEVDIPPDVYERGGGYSWKKSPGVAIRAADVVLNKIPREWIEADDDD